MNIRKAKEEIKHTIEAYSLVDENGESVIERNHQRPILLMGAPGLGKTAIMEQIASEMGIGLVSYNMTHHTRQSALGLPIVSEKTYNDEKMKVTEYTISEIIASIYDEMEDKGIDRGILFLDEINCVSETLTPVVLQLLQCKMFGRVEVPDGWTIVCAGNPEEYNRSVREFDMVTLDRIRKINIEPDIKVWKEYAADRDVHRSVISYLNVRSDNFYKAELTVDGLSFVTARGWDDLSDCIKAYSKLGIELEEETIKEYISEDNIANDFYNFYMLYKKYERIFDIEKILSSEYEKSEYETLPFDGRVSLVGVLLAYLDKDFKSYEHRVRVQDGLYRFIKELSNGTSIDAIISNGKYEGAAYSILKEWNAECVDIEEIKERFFRRNEEIETFTEELKDKLDSMYDFLENVYGASEELVLFTTELASKGASLYFMTEQNYTKFFEYNRELLSSEFDVENEILNELG